MVSSTGFARAHVACWARRKSCLCFVEMLLGASVFQHLRSVGGIFDVLAGKHVKRREEMRVGHSHEELVGSSFITHRGLFFQGGALLSKLCTLSSFLDPPETHNMVEPEMRFFSWYTFVRDIFSASSSRTNGFGNRMRACSRTFFVLKRPCNRAGCAASRVCHHSGVRDG